MSFVLHSYPKLKSLLYFLTIHYFAEKMGFANDLLQRKDGNGFFLKVWNFTKVMALSCSNDITLHEFMLDWVVWIILLIHMLSVVMLLSFHVPGLVEWPSSWKNI